MKKSSFHLAGISLGAICDCCVPPFLLCTRICWGRGLYSKHGSIWVTEASDCICPQTSLPQAHTMPVPSPFPCRPQGPDPQPALRCHCSFVSILLAQEGGGKTGRKLETIPEEALSAEQRGAIASLDLPATFLQTS